MVSTKLLYKLLNAAIKEHESNVELYYIAKRTYEVDPHSGTKAALDLATQWVRESERKFKMYAQHITAIETTA